MRRAALSFAVLFLVVACNADDRPLSASCTPAVNVAMPKPNVPRRKPSAAGVPRREVVQVYWDVSRSMRDFTAAHHVHGRPAEKDDLTPIVEALDSSVLLRAHAETVEQYGVGDSIAPLASARDALHPTANRTALHLAAERLGKALATGEAQAALVVSDMELDTPPRSASSPATVCGGVPLPSTSLAGPLFGRCFENAVLASEDAAPIRRHLLAHVFRKSTHGRELFILLLATDHAFGRRISDEIVRRLDFSLQTIFDSDAVAVSNVVGCTLTAAAPGVRLRGPGCGAKCFDPDSTIQAECDVRRQTADAWIRPVGRGADGVAYESLKKGGDRDEQAAVRFEIPCNTPPGRFTAALSFDWRSRTPWSQGGSTDFAHTASVRDLFDSLTDAIVRVVPPRKLQIGIDLAK